MIRVINEFDAAINASIDYFVKNDQSFKDTFEPACVNGNILLATEDMRLLFEGLEELLRRRLL